MMIKGQPTRRAVYKHCRGIFTGLNGRVRKTKSVQKLLEKNKHTLGALNSEYNIGAVCEVAKELLNAGIFESPLEAEAHFPELFQFSCKGRAQSESSDFDATRSETDAMEAIIFSEEESIKSPHVLHSKISQRGKSDRPQERLIVILS